MDKSNDGILQQRNQSHTLKTELGEYNSNPNVEDKSTLLGIAGNISEYVTNVESGSSKLTQANVKDKLTSPQPIRGDPVEGY